MGLRFPNPILAILFLDRVRPADAGMQPQGMSISKRRKSAGRDVLAFSIAWSILKVTISTNIAEPYGTPRLRRRF